MTKYLRRAATALRAVRTRLVCRARLVRAGALVSLSDTRKNMRQALTLQPMIGGAPEGDDDDSGGGDDDDQDDDDENDDDAGDGDDDEDSDDDQDDDEDSDDGTAELRAEVARLRREAGERERKAREAKRERDRKAGRYEQLAKDAEAERDEALEAKAAAEAELEEFRRTAKVTEVAKRLKFHDPADAYSQLTPEQREGTEAQVEKALRGVLKRKKYLADTGAERRGGGMGGAGSDGGTADEDDLTLDDLKGKSPEWINKNWERVQKIQQAAAK